MSPNLLRLRNHDQCQTASQDQLQSTHTKTSYRINRAYAENFFHTLHKNLHGNEANPAELISQRRLVHRNASCNSNSRSERSQKEDTLITMGGIFELSGNILLNKCGSWLIVILDSKNFYQKKRSTDDQRLYKNSNKKLESNQSVGEQKIFIIRNSANSTSSRDIGNKKSVKRSKLRSELLPKIDICLFKTNLMISCLEQAKLSKDPAYSIKANSKRFHPGKMLKQRDK